MSYVEQLNKLNAAISEQRAQREMLNRSIAELKREAARVMPFVHAEREVAEREAEEQARGNRIVGQGQLAASGSESNA